MLIAFVILILFLLLGSYNFEVMHRNLFRNEQRQLPQ